MEPGPGNAAVIEVAGDSARDFFLEEIPHHASLTATSEKVAVETAWNWEREPGHHLHEIAGGAHLMYDMIRAAKGRGAPIAAGTSGLLRSLAVVEQVKPAPDKPSPALPATGFEPSDLATTGDAKTPQIEKRQMKKGAALRWRIARFLGFQRPRATTTALTPPMIIPLHAGDQPSFDLKPSVVVIDNAGNGFRDNKDSWATLFARATPFDAIIVKMNWPLPPNDGVGDPRPGEDSARLWPMIEKAEAACKIVIVNGYDLRNANVELSYRLSWDRAIHDLDRQLQTSPTLRALTARSTLIVRLGLEGAAILCPNGSIRLICEPGHIEGDHEAGMNGGMPGLTSAFTAGLVAELTREPPPFAATDTALDDAVRAGLVTSRKLFAAGYVMMETKATGGRRLAIPFDTVFERATSAGPLFVDGEIRALFVPMGATAGTDIRKLRKVGWTPAGDGDLARDLLLNGKKGLDAIPHATIGDLVIADRQEIENYRSVANLLATYAGNPALDKPLSIAVFGRPGSGKSFGIKEIAKTLGPTGRAGKAIKSEDVNVAQWKVGEPRDLIGALHLARDCRIRGELPLIFFDEFDSEDGAWLKTFLAPMQDGEFKDGGHNHKVDRAIFVFAGGTAETMETFNKSVVIAAKMKDLVALQSMISKKETEIEDNESRIKNRSSDVSVAPSSDVDRLDDTEKSTDAATMLDLLDDKLKEDITELNQGIEALAEDIVTFEKVVENFKAAKGPDFVSRLSGFVNISSIDDGGNGDGHKLRRALVLRSLFERRHQSLLDRDNRLQMDRDVLNAFLDVPTFHHGVRSIEAIVRMSALGAKTPRFARSALPPAAQLELHTSADAFLAACKP